MRLKRIADTLHQFGYAQLLGSFWLITEATKMLACVRVTTILLQSHCQVIMKASVRPNSYTRINMYSSSTYCLAGKTMHSNFLKVS